MRRVVLLAVAGSAAAFLPVAPFGSTAPALKASSGTPVTAAATMNNV